MAKLTAMVLLGGDGPRAWPHKCPKFAEGSTEDKCKRTTADQVQNLLYCVPSECNACFRMCSECAGDGLKHDSDPPPRPIFRSGFCETHYNKNMAVESRTVSSRIHVATPGKIPDSQKGMFLKPRVTGVVGVSHYKPASNGHVDAAGSSAPCPAVASVRQGSTKGSPQTLPAQSVTDVPSLLRKRYASQIQSWKQVIDSYLANKGNAAAPKLFALSEAMCALRAKNLSDADIAHIFGETDAWWVQKYTVLRHLAVELRTLVDDADPQPPIDAVYEILLGHQDTHEARLAALISGGPNPPEFSTSETGPTHSGPARRIMVRGRYSETVDISSWQDLATRVRTVRGDSKRPHYPPAICFEISDALKAMRALGVSAEDAIEFFGFSPESAKTHRRRFGLLQNFIPEERKLIAQESLFALSESTIIAQYGDPAERAPLIATQLARYKRHRERYGK